MRYWRPVWVALAVAGAAYVIVTTALTPSPYGGYDVAAYWALDPADPYRVHVAPALGAFLYSPPIAWLFQPLGLLDLHVARMLWLTLEASLLALMTGPLTIVAAFLPPVQYELNVGNIGLLMAASLVAGLTRWPAAWAFPILTKVTPIVGLAWFVGRRDWRGLVIASGTTLVIAAVSFVVVPGLWFEWLGVLTDNRAVTTDLYLGPLWLRAGLATGVCWWAGRTNRSWLVPIAVALSLGHLWISGLSIAIASVSLFWLSARERYARSHGGTRTI